MDKINQQEYNAIDLAKFICALLVVAIHVAPFGSNDIMICKLFNYAIQNWFARIAVPIFLWRQASFYIENHPLKTFLLFQQKSMCAN